MDGRTLAQQDVSTVAFDSSRRRSMRVLLSVPIRVQGKTSTDEEFDEQTRTLVVNAHGALISLTACVAVDQILTISNKATNLSRECRVVHVGTVLAGKTQVGIEFINPSPSFWQIDFPPDDWVAPEN